MVAQNNQGYDESKFSPKQREAAHEMVEYEFTPKEARKTQDQIAAELGITRRTLYNWNTNDANFIAYKNHLAGQFADTHLAFVYKKLIDAIDRGSVRGIETFLKRAGDLDTETQVTLKSDQGDNQSFEQRKDELMKRLSGEENQDNSGSN